MVVISVDSNTQYTWGPSACVITNSLGGCTVHYKLFSVFGITYSHALFCDITICEGNDIYCMTTVEVKHDVFKDLFH